MNENSRSVLWVTYGSASLVVIWLGTADDSTEPAISFLNDLSGQMLEYMKIQKLKSFAEAQTVKDPFQYPPLETPV